MNITRQQAIRVINITRYCCIESPKCQTDEVIYFMSDALQDRLMQAVISKNLDSLDLADRHIVVDLCKSWKGQTLPSYIKGITTHLIKTSSK